MVTRATMLALPAVLACWTPVKHPAPAPDQHSSPHVAPSALPADLLRLRPILPLRGTLALHVVYPTEGALVDGGDSSFVFGSVGNGDARVTVAGQQVSVWPNGGWLGWIRLPRDTISNLAVVAATSTDTARLSWTIRRPVRFRPPARGPWIDTTAFAPAGDVWWPLNEELPLEVRASPGALVSLVLGNGQRVPFHAMTEPVPVAEGIRAFDRDTANLRTGERADRYRGVVRGVPIGALLGSALGATPLGRRATVGRATIEAVIGADTARAAWPLRLSLLDTVPETARLDDDPDGVGGTDGITVGRTSPGASYHWFFPQGTIVRIVGRVNEHLRVQLGLGGPVVWLAATEARPHPGAPLGSAVIGSVTLTPSHERTSLRIPISHRAPYRVVEDVQGISLEVYGATGDLKWIRYGEEERDNPPLVQSTSWTQERDHVRIRFDLGGPVWGYRIGWSRNDLRLELRRMPHIDRDAPLHGLRIAVDAGHPPGGSTGPTGLKEPEANLWIATELADLFRRAGATVQMLRPTAQPVGLAERVRLADSADANLLVSIHNNALPDGVNPFPNHGTSVFYNQLRSLPLARSVQQALVARLGTRDLGVARGDLAVLRSTWMPSILVEGLFMMLPEHEAALRTQVGQRLYALGVFEGVERYLRMIAP